MSRELATERGAIRFPAFLPVTTFGGKYPLDDVVRPFLDRFASAAMVSHYYAQQMKGRPGLPLFVDSGGFASLFEGSKILEEGRVAVIRTKDGTLIHPKKVLAFQQKNAEIGATVDFLIPPNLPEAEAERRQELTVRNALWALRRRNPGPFRLYASVQAWDPPSARRILTKLAVHPFDGFALGGMVPRISRPDTILAIVEAIRSVEPTRPLHIFGIGQPKLIRRLFDAGVDSVDSSSYVQYAADRKYLDPSTGEYQVVANLPDDLGACPCSVCQSYPRDYLALEGELNAMALTLHNLAALKGFLGLGGGS